MKRSLPGSKSFTNGVSKERGDAWHTVLFPAMCDDPGDQVAIPSLSKIMLAV